MRTYTNNDADMALINKMHMSGKLKTPGVGVDKFITEIRDFRRLGKAIEHCQLIVRCYDNKGNLVFWTTESIDFANHSHSRIRHNV